MTKRLVSISLLAAVVVLGAWFWTDDKGPPAPVRQSVSQAAEIGVTVGKSAPQFILKDLDGKGVPLVQQGKVTVINFWATWCPPCREEMPELEKFVQKNGASIAFAGVNIQESPGKIAEFLRQHSYTVPVLLDSDGAVAGAYRVGAIPTTVVTDREGIVRFRKTGTVTQAELEAVIKDL